MSDAVPTPRKGMPDKVQFLVTCDIAKGEVEIRGPIHQKMFAIKVLADAMRIVTDYVPPAIAIPGKNGAPLAPAPHE